MRTRIIGGFLVLAGSAAAGVGLGMRFSLLPATYILFGAGVIALAVGFGLCSSSREKASRASVGFIIHVASLVAVAAAFFAYRSSGRVAPLFVAAIAAQVAVGLLLLPCVLEAKRRVGPAFIASVVVYAFMLGGSILLAVKAY